MATRSLDCLILAVESDRSFARSDDPPPPLSPQAPPTSTAATAAATIPALIAAPFDVVTRVLPTEGGRCTAHYAPRSYSWPGSMSSPFMICHRDARAFVALRSANGGSSSP